MSIVLETGAIVLNANSYVSVATIDAYHESRGNTAWADATDEQKEAALIRGQESLARQYQGRWVGVKTNNNTGVVNPQELPWPRKKEADKEDPIKDADGIEIGINTIPSRLKQAQMEAALIELTTSIVPKTVDQTRYVQSEQVDVISTTYFDSKPAVDRYPVLDRLLEGLAATGGDPMNVIIGLTEEEVNQGDTTLEGYITDTTYFNVIP